MFGAGGMVTGVLNKDLEDNTGGFEKAAKRVREAAAGAGAPAPATALDVFLAELAARPLAELRKDRKTGAVVCGLWMSRALLFVGRFGSRLILAPGASPSEVAKAVYAEVLRPYHGMITGGVVSMAFGLAPSRIGAPLLPRPPSPPPPFPPAVLNPACTPHKNADFFKRMGTLEADAAGELAAFVKYVLPMVEAFNAWFVEAGHNFPDKA